MSLFRSTIRPTAPVSDEAIVRYVAAIHSDVEPDAAFRRRLRGHVVNRYVAAREGMVAPRTPGREMTRIGRAVLYASFALGVSVTGVMAASQHAIPGDMLYPLKRDVEALRYRVAPAHLHDELAAHALAERVVELERLADSATPADVAAHAPAVERAYEEVVVLGGASPAVEDRMTFIVAVLERLPTQARAAVEAALHDVIPGPATPPAGLERPPNPAAGRGESGGQPNVPPGQGPRAADPSPGDGAPMEHGPESEDTSSPSPTPVPAATQKPRPPQATEPARPPHPPHAHASQSPEAP